MGSVILVLGAKNAENYCGKGFNCSFFLYNFLSHVELLNLN